MELVSFTPLPLYHRGKTDCRPTNGGSIPQRLDWLEYPPGAGVDIRASLDAVEKKKSLPLPGIEPSFVGLQVVVCTQWSF
jgi:hypothetical protein